MNIKKFVAIPVMALVAALSPMSSFVGSAGGSIIPAPTLSASYVDETIKLKWTAYDYSQSGWEGYAVFKAKPGNEEAFKVPFALLKFENNNYSYYNLSGMKAGNYNWTVSLYDYDINGLKFDHFSNSVAVEIPKKAQAPENPNPPVNPQPPVAPKPPKENADVQLKVKKTESEISASWSAYSGVFDGYILTLVEAGRGGKTYDKNKIYYYFSKNVTSTENLNVIAGRKYQLQVFPYTKNADDKTVTYVKDAESNIAKLVIPEHKIKLSIYHSIVGHGIVGQIESKNSNLIDGYAVYLAPGIKGQASLSQVTPIFIGKNETSFEFKNLTAGIYTVKVYAYNERPSGAKVYHQPGSKFESVEIITAQIL